MIMPNVGGVRFVYFNISSICVKSFKKKPQKPPTPSGSPSCVCYVERKTLRLLKTQYLENIA